jgi:hypothetical protein
LEAEDSEAGCPEGPLKPNFAHGSHDPKLLHASTIFEDVQKVIRVRAEVQDSQLGDDEVGVSQESGQGSNDRPQISVEFDLKSKTVHV